MVRWTAKLSNGEDRMGYTDNGSWKTLKPYLDKNNLKILELEISNKSGVGRIDKNCDGYFIGNKIIAVLNQPGQETFVGIGYWRKNEDVVRIKWYDAETMELKNTEARKLEETGISLVKN